MAKGCIKMSDKTIMVTVVVVVAVIALVGLLLVMGVSSTGQAWQDKPTAPTCPYGWTKAWMHSNEHTNMLDQGMYCTPSAVRGMVCCKMLV